MNLRDLRKSKFIQFPLIKKPLSWLYKSFWYFIRHSIKSDKAYLSFVYLCRFRKKINWKNPQTFNEKLQWLKLYNHRNIYTIMADKYAVKQHVEKILGGGGYVVPCYGYWTNAGDIDFDKLPNQFALKCNHNSGRGRCICKNKSELDIERVRKNIQKGLDENYYLPGREKQYRDIPKKIIAEKYLNDGTGDELRDYKFWCFDGVPKYMYCTNKGTKIYENFYDMEFNPVYINHGYPRLSPELEKPEEFDLMKKLAIKLSMGIPFVRVDFFIVNHHVYFSEFTFFDWGGLKPFGADWDKTLGELIDLTKINKYQS